MIPYIVLGAAAVAVYIATRPDEFTITRSKHISAPPDKIFPHLNDFRKWAAWSPWERLDPALTRNYGGAPSGPGSTYEWEGNNKVGKGRMEITDAAAPTRVDIRLEFIRPWTATNTTVFTLTPDATGTTVQWSMSGKNDYKGKAFSMVMNMDKLVGADFERGLDALKGIAEAS